MFLRNIVLSNGDEFKVVVDDLSVPLYYENLYIIHRIHNRRLGVSSIQLFFDSRKLLRLWEDRKQIRIEQLFANGHIISNNQIAGLCTELGIKLRYLKKRNSFVQPIPRSTKARRRIKQSSNVHCVSVETQISRIRNVRSYIDWLHQQLRPNEHVARASMKAAFKDNTPTLHKKDDWDIDDGILPQMVEQVLNEIDPNSSKNFFAKNQKEGDKQYGIRLRNFLIVLILYDTGMRCGELLALRLEDLNFQRNTITIIRRQDSGEDPRNTKPKAKTLGRVIKVNNSIMAILQKYLVYRNNLPSSGAHSFVFVTHVKNIYEAGSPLTISTIEKIFKLIRDKVSAVDIADLHPHALRHTWNYNFSLLSDANRDTISHTDESELRCRQMGWSPTGKSITNYNKRHILKKAAEVESNLEIDFKNIYSGDPNANL